MGEVHLREEEEARIESEGEGASVLLSISLYIAESEVNVDSLVCAGGGREGAGTGAAVEFLNSAGGGAAILVDEVAIIAEGGVRGKKDPVPADLDTGLSGELIVLLAITDSVQGWV